MENRVYHYTNFSRGYVVEWTKPNVEQCKSWILLPAENLWPEWLRGILYLVAMLYIFVGIAIVSDVFMCSIEVITSKKKKVIRWDPERNQKVEREVLVWNETVANLTLMAVGSSAPEILLAVMETALHITEEPTGEDSLGTFTIIGSAAFNLLMITAICITSVPSPNVKRIKEFGVFMLTAAWSIFAYVWILIVTLWSSKGEIDLWEAWVTLGFSAVLVLSAYAQDKGWWIKRTKVDGTPDEATSHTNVRVINGNLKHRGSVMHGVSKELETLEAEKTASTINLKHAVATEEMNGHGNDIVLRDLEAGENGDRQSSANATSVLEEKSQFARARFRHAAVRSMLGGRKKHAQERAQTPRLRALVEKVRAMQEEAKGVVPTEELKGKFTFAKSAYQVYESAGKLDVEVLFHRRAPKQFPVNGNVTENGNALTYEVRDDESGPDNDFINSVVNVLYETREGTAKPETEFQFTQGKLIFKETEWRKTITIPIVNDNQYESDMDFYLILKNPEGGAGLGDPSVTRVTIIDDDVPGEFSFLNPTYAADMNKGVLTAEVVRTKGSDGNVTLQYTTIDGTAKGGPAIDEGIDYITTSGTLCFKHNETSKLIDIEVNKDAKGSKNFVITLRNPSVGAKLGEHSAAVANLNSDDLEARLANVLSDDDEEQETWGEQIKGAMTVGGDVDENGKEIPPSKIDYILHFVTFFWKVLFSFIPPCHYGGGWPSFFISLFWIGCLTAVVEQLGGLLGCVMNIRASVAGITIIALGTSVPDTFASRSAAIQDTNADAAIGNITGSNSVNVFLGLGLPWIMSSMYNRFQDPPRKFIIGVDNLDLAVPLFASVGTVCIILLIIRRKVFGGELGGRKFSKFLSGAFLATLWVIYILICTLRAYKIL